MTWRRWLLDGPRWIVARVPPAFAWLWRALWLLIAAASILCFTATALALVL